MTPKQQKILEAMKETENKFKSRLFELMEEFGVKVEEHESFDDEEGYTGSSYIFRAENIYLYVDELIKK